MTKYVFRNGNLVNKATGEPLVTEDREICAPYITSDLPAYRSPVTGQMVDGRSARREDLKRSGCRECDPSEFNVRYRSKAKAMRAGREHDPDANKVGMKYSGFLA